MSVEELLDLTDKDKRFIAACYAMQSILTEEYSATMYDPAAFTAKRAVRYADELIKALGESDGSQK